MCIERTRRTHRIPGLKELLRFAELDLLATLRAELTTQMHARPELKARYRSRTEEVDRWIGRLGDENEG